MAPDPVPRLRRRQAPCAIALIVAAMLSSDVGFGFSITAPFALRRPRPSRRAMGVRLSHVPEPAGIDADGLRPMAGNTDASAAAASLSVGSRVELLADRKVYTVVERRAGGWWQLKAEDGSGLVSARRKGFQLCAGGYAPVAAATRPPPPPPRPPSPAIPPPRAPPGAAAPPTAQGLVAHLDAAQLRCPHEAVREWVLFSDLHLSERSLGTCLEVLRAVHEAAVSRGAGIIFLGDFWHVRGTLPVAVLNPVLSALSQWTQPVVLLPGNHDQVTLGGDVHALTPLQFALQRSHPSQCVVIESPSMFLGALWVPYLRDPSKLEAVLASQEARTAAAIFCHTDVAGARMNDGRWLRVPALVQSSSLALSRT